MVNGYLLRDVINRVNDIHFTSKDEIHTLGHMYESCCARCGMPRATREFYTPRSLVKFIIAVVDPSSVKRFSILRRHGRLPGRGFRASAGAGETRQDYDRLQHGTLNGIEAKPLPYLLCEMNLLLHGMEYPEIDPDNALRFPLREIGDKDRVDVHRDQSAVRRREEEGYSVEFPEDKQTAETALLYLQLIMRKLRRPVGVRAPGRCRHGRPQRAAVGGRDIGSHQGGADKGF